MELGESVYSVNKKGKVSKHKTLKGKSDDILYVKVNPNSWSYDGCYKQDDGTWKHVGVKIKILYATKQEAIEIAIAKRQLARLRYVRKIATNERELKKLLCKGD